MDLDALLPPAPPTPLDETGAPRIGAYSGSLERADLEALVGTGVRGALRRKTRLKTWQYVGLMTSEVVAALAIVDLGYACNAFFFAADLRERKMLVTRSFLGLPGISAQVADRPGLGACADFSARGATLHFERVASRYLGTARLDPDVSLDFTLDTQPAPPAVTLVVPIDGGTLNATQKWAALPMQGSLVVAGRRFELGGGFGGLDYTRGLLGRESVWRWAFASGRAQGGAPVGFNLGEGFNAVMPGENALWRAGGPALQPSVHFTFDRDAPLAPWRIRSDDGSVDLTFTGAGVYRDARNYLLIQSRFAQVAGTFTGRVRGPGGAAIEVVDLPGVVEDQAVRW